MRTRPALAVLIFSGWLAGCRGPSEPTLQLPLREGAQQLEVIGGGGSEVPEFPACGPPGVPRHGTQVSLPVTVSRDGADWVVRATEVRPDRLEFRLHAIGGTNAGGAAYTGRIQGGARDAGEAGSPAVDVEALVSTAPPAFVTGGVNSTFTHGKIAGLIQFRDSAGNIANCSGGTLFLRPPIS